MKNKLCIILFFLCYIPFFLSAQEFDIVLSTPESGNQTHTARNTITFAPGFLYTPGGGSMLARIENPVVNGIITYNSVVDPSNRTLNTTYLVGTTNGSLNINPLGGATYTLPLDLPQGVNGLAPRLSLVYSSNSGNGIAGYGWQISGISVISRSPQNFYNDGTVKDIELNYNDRFTLDGQRLIITAGNYGEHNATYQTENDIFTRVVSEYSSGNGPEKFFAQTKNGLKYLYGFDEDGRQKIGNFNEVLNWYVTEISDLYGNIMSYSYLKDNNAVYLGEISYGPNTVTFYYIARFDVITSYFKGNKIIQRLLLDHIDIKYNGTLVKKYELKYNDLNDNYNKYSLLNEVVEYGINNSRLNSTVFTYTTPSAVSLSQSIYNQNHYYVTYKSKIVAGDYNGDGKTDFFCIPIPGKATWTGFKVCYGDGNDNFDNIWGNSSIDMDYAHIDDIRSIDLNGDGKDDILIEYEIQDVSYFYVMISSGNYLSEPVIFYNNSVLCSSSGKRFRKYLLQEDDNELNGSDYNGDGINDVFINDRNGNWIILSYGNPSGVLTYPTKNVLGSGTISTLSDHLISDDFNGDGKADIWSFESSGLKIYTLTGSSLVQIYSSNWPTKDHHFTLGDFNGDGKTDLFIYGYSTYDWTQWQIRLSTGTGFETINIPQKKSNLKNDYVRLGDFNGDGCTDLMASSISNNYTYFYISRYRGTDFNTHTIPNYPIATHRYFVADYNGDGRTDFVCTDGEDPWWNGYQLYKSPGNTSVLLEKTGNGYNHITQISYSKLSQPSSNYTKGTGAAFPVFDFQGPLSVVRRVISENGAGSNDTVNYFYEGAKIHRQGKGFLCFSKITSYDVASGIKTENASGYNSTYFYPQVTYTYKKLSTGNAFETVSNSWSHIVLDAAKKRIFPFISTSTQNNALTGHSITTSFAYDNYGNPTNITKSYSNGVTETTINTYTNTISDTQWLLGKLNQSTVTYSRPGETPISRTVSLTYYTDGILKPDFIKYYENTNLYYYKNHDYDSHGNLIQLYEYGTGEGSRQTNYTYETNGIRIKTVTDPLRHVTTMNYDTYGRLSSEVDYLGNTTTYTYDNLGRITTKTQPDGFVASTSYNWGLTGVPANACYYVQNSGNDGSLSQTWYDKIGREIRKDVKGFSGSMICTNMEYNAKGQIYRISDPYFSGGSVTWAETYTYDSYGRTTSITRNTGRNTTFTYSGATITEVTGGKPYSKTYGPDGTIVSATDNGGTISYSYYPDGKVKTITAPGGVVTSMEYDIAGNQTKLVDPNAGTISYTYNAFGQINTMTNVRGQTTTYNYYADGRPYTTVSPEGTITYSYNSNKQLIAINSPGGVIRNITYDSLERVISFRETIPGSTALTTSYTYDSKGRLKTRTHPSGITETLNYNNFGYFSYISLPGLSQAYSISYMNARGQITSESHNSAFGISRGYDGYGFPVSSTASIYTYVYFQKLQYSFDPVTGNLLWRKDLLKNQTENFTYDNLDRLTAVSGPTPLTMTYAANGNLSGKSDIGAEFLYEAAAKPYALTKVTCTTGAIPSVPQSISYTSFEKVRTITEDPFSASFIYNSDHERARMELKQNGNTLLTRWYSGSRYIKEVAGSDTTQYTFIGGDAYSAPVIAITRNNSTAYYALLRDYLGNITQVVAIPSNILVAEFSYDAWGRRRNPANWTYDLSGQPELFAGRGFTGHEVLPWFNLINMNGRLYDPLVGRFLSPDNFVQAPDFTQNFNRYGYCLNNPLMYTDPDGELFWLIPVAIGAAIGGWSGYQIGKAHGAKGWDMFGYIAGGAAIGGLSGGAAAGVSALGGGAMLAGLAAGGVGGAGFSGLATNWNGSAMLTGAVNGAIAGFVGGGVGGAIGGGWGALAGGAASNLTSQLLYNDGDFSSVNWASVGISGATSFGLYHGMQYMQYRAMDGKLGQLDVTYRQFSKINTAYQRSRFWHKEYGVVLNRNGSARFVPGADRHKYDVTLKLYPRNGDYATAHTHWAKDGVDLGGGVFTVGGHHSPDDLINIPGYSLVVGRTTSTYSIGGTGVYNYITPDPFIRFFMFPWNW